MTSSMADDQLRISVIGAQTAAPETPTPYTVYRTVVTYGGECYERLLRYSEFRGFYKKLKTRGSAPAPSKFPARKWSRKSSLEDELIEARQVMLNEFMKDVTRTELAPQSEQQLMKLLKIGKFEDGSGRVSELSSSKPSFIKSDRGGRLDTVMEAKGDEVQGNDRRKAGVALDRAATLAASSVAFPAITSNATTVLTDDERSEIGSQPRTRDAYMDESAAAVEAAATPPPSAPSRAAPRKSTSSIPPSSYSDMMLQRPQLKASQSLPVRRSKRVEFPQEQAAAPVSAPTNGASASAADEATEWINHDDDADCDASASPEKKYRNRISTQLDAINRLLSESEAETELDSLSSRSFQTQPMAMSA